MKKISILFLALAFWLSGASGSQAASYSVGGASSSPGCNTLDSCFMAHATLTNDMYILFADDSSLITANRTLGADNLTFRSNDATLRTLTSASSPITTGNGAYLNLDASVSRLNLINLAISNNQTLTGSGGALHFDSGATITLSIQGVTFSDNTAGNANADWYTGYGGALNTAFAELNFSGSSDVLFSNNLADGGNGEQSGRGGAIYAGSANLSQTGGFTFADNQARGGTGNDSGLGGAIYSTDRMDLSQATGFRFSGNKATGGQANGSGRGGAIYTQSLNLDDASDIIFSGNTAVASWSSSGTTLSLTGRGGAVFLGGGLNLSGASGIIFENNEAHSFSLGPQANLNENSALGGAIFLDRDWSFLPEQRSISGTVFRYNRALTDSSKESSGRGGAIFNSGAQLTLLADGLGRNIEFYGNTHNPGSSGEIPNSIYFGNTDPAPLYTDFRVDVGADNIVSMYDPLASQPDIMDGNTNNGALTLSVEKTGQGTWLLAGHNDMRSATDWHIRQGTLYLEKNPYSSAAGSQAAYLDLSHANSSFTLDVGSRLLFTPLTEPHIISAATITLAPGSGVGLLDGGFFSYSQLPGKDNALLSLRAGNSLLNDSSILNPNGTFTVGFYDYEYGLYWKEIMDNDPTVAERQDLLLFLKETYNDPGSGGGSDNGPGSGGGSGNGPGPDGGSYNRQSAGASALTGPLAIAAQNTLSRRLDERLRWNFTRLGKAESAPLSTFDAPGASEATLRSAAEWGQTDIWMTTPSYRYTSRSGEGGYTVREPGLAGGMDIRLNGSFFLGAGLFSSLPEYRSDDANIDAKRVDLALYGGLLLPAELEFSFLAGWGYTSYDQKRRVFGQRYSSDYSSDGLHLGAGLGRSFALAPQWIVRPFAVYDYLALRVDSYNEKSGDYALKVDSHTEHLHFLRAGTDLTWHGERESFLTAGVYYSGIYGDTRPEAGAFFVQDPDRHRYTSYGDRLDEDFLGLSLRGGLNLSSNIELTVNYDFEVGRKTRQHTAGLSLIFTF